MKRLLLAGAIAGALLTAQAANAASYVAYDGFNIVSDAFTSSNFNFGYSGSTFNSSLTAFPRVQAACYGNTNIACASNGEVGIFKPNNGSFSTGNTSFFELGYLNLHPDVWGNMPVVQFVAPIAGDYNFNGQFKIHDVSPTGVDLFTYINMNNWLATPLTQGSYDIGFTAALAAGDKVSFLVGPQGNWTYDSTGFKLQVNGPDYTPPGGGGPISAVPEPATWAMMIMGFGLAGSALRASRRRQMSAA